MSLFTFRFFHSLRAGRCFPRLLSYFGIHLLVHTYFLLTPLVHRHLARNPFICDCNLRWLADYLHKNPIETSGARCDAPKRMHRRRIEALRDEKFKCKHNLFSLCTFFVVELFGVSCEKKKLLPKKLELLVLMMTRITTLQKHCSKICLR